MKVSLLSESKKKLTEGQCRLELFEIGTAKMLYSIDPHMALADIAWSPDSKFISLFGKNFKSQQQLLAVDAQLYDKILSIHDASIQDKNLWQHYPINLVEINNEQQLELARVHDQEQREIKIRQNFHQGIGDYETDANRVVFQP